MPFHLAARLHAFIHGLFKPSDEQVTSELFAKVERSFSDHGLGGENGRARLIANLWEEVCRTLKIDTDHQQARIVHGFTAAILDYEGLFELPEIDWDERRSVTEYWVLRDELDRQRKLADAFPQARSLLIEAVCQAMAAIHRRAPALLQADAGDGITVDTSLIDCIRDLGELTGEIVSAMTSEDAEAIGLFPKHLDRLHFNLVVASGGSPHDPHGFARALKPPAKSEIKDPNELIHAYLGGTPLLPLFNQQVSFTIPTKARFEHHHIIAGSGHGKTQTLQYLIGHDLEAVAKGDRSVVVLDSQGDLIRNISQLAEFAPGGPQHDQIVIIDPTDVEWPVSLNLFDVGIDRLKGYAPLERERLTNSILELYDFVLGSLLAAEMTQKQSVIFRYVTRLMLHIPDATIHTLRELMEPGSQVKFAPHIAKLSGTARHFFETEFASKEFEQTKKQVLRRLWGILENQTFERMFSHPRSKLDLFAEMNAGKVILINTAKDLLKETGTEIFGRFFIAMIAQAAQERATLREHDRMPTMVYIDEAADYFDRNIGIILGQARKYRVGMVLAHQYLGQLDPKLQEAFAANTSIKFAGGVSNKDARSLAPQLYCEPRMIEAQEKGGFAAHVRGVTKSALPLSFPFGWLEKKSRMSGDERSQLQERMRERYAVHYTELDQPEHHAEPKKAATEDKDASTPAAASTTPDPKTPTDPTAQW